MRKLINVLSKDIKTGVTCDCKRCPVALAIRRAFPDVAVAVEIGFVSLNGFRHGLPRSVRRFINKFDKTKKGKAFNFYLDACDED